MVVSRSNPTSYVLLSDRDEIRNPDNHDVTFVLQVSLVAADSFVFQTYVVQTTTTYQVRYGSYGTVPVVRYRTVLVHSAYPQGNKWTALPLYVSPMSDPQS